MGADEQRGYFLWETLLLTMILLFMTAAAGLYVQSVRLQSSGTATAAMNFLAGTQLAYLQAELDKTGSLPGESAYLGPAADLTQNRLKYEVYSRQQRQGDSVQAVVYVSWKGRGGTGSREFSRCLVRH